MRRANVILMTPELLSRMLGLPEGHLVTDARRDFGATLIELVVEGPTCDEQGEGCQPMRRNLADVMDRLQ